MKNHSKRPCNSTQLNLMDLPMELLVEILKRVPAKSVCRIGCVCKMLLSIVVSPSFVTLHSNFVFNPDSHLSPAPPQFVLQFQLSGYLCSHKIKLRTNLHSLHYNPSNAQLIPRLILESPTACMIQSVFRNLFCINYCHSRALGFLINPLRGEVLRLPSGHNIIAHQVYGTSSKEESGCWTGMGFDSITNTYKVLCVTWILVPVSPRRSERCSVSLVLELGTSKWRRVPTLPRLGEFQPCKSIFAHGDLHWLVSCRREGIRGKIHILCFDFKKEEFCWIPNPYILPALNLELYLIAFRGSIAIVDATSGTKIEIWVMKDYSRKQWMLDYSINIKMLDYPLFKFLRAVCCEWEHGILFIDQPATLTLVLDLRGPDMTKSLLRCPIQGCYRDIRRIMSLDGSLMSLKSYANLVEAEEPATYSTWSEGEASGKNFFYLKRAERH